MSLISEFLASTDDSESPASYFYWSFLSAIAAVTNNNTSIQRHYYRMSPNIFVLLFGKSGLRKGVPINLAKQLVEQTGNTRTIAGRSSIQAIVAQLGQAYTREGHTPITDAIGFVSASEFASSLVDDDAALTILTDLYDGNYNKEWKSNLVSRDSIKLKNVNLTILGGINSPHFKEAISQSNLQGGFIGRTFIIYETKKRRSNSLVYAPKVNLEEIITYFLPHFIEISNIKGEFQWTIESGYFYNEWYNEFDKIEVEENTGTMMRLGDHVIKVAMLLALSQKRLTLELTDIEDSINACINFSANANRAASGNTNTSSLSPIVRKICEQLYKQSEHRMSRKQILQKLYPEGVLSPEVDACLSTLCEMGFVMNERNGHDIYYFMDETGLIAYDSMFGGKK